MTAVKHTILDQLILHEGVVPHAYQDSLGFWTIGVGRLIDKRRGGKLSDDEIRLLLTNDLNRTIEAVDGALPWWRQLDDVRKKVLLDMAFNMGLPTLLTFRNTLAAMQAGDYPRAAAGMLASRWAQQTGQRARRLAKMMQTGEDYDG